MPLLSSNLFAVIVTGQSPTKNPLAAFRARAQAIIHGNSSVKFPHKNVKKSTRTWISVMRTPYITKLHPWHPEKRCSDSLIMPVAVLEANCLVQSDSDHHTDDSFLLPETKWSLTSKEDSAEAGKRENLRRMRISKANKGKSPWNKGRKHSAETLKLIREKTRLAMQDPKIKMKLADLGHAQDNETRMKIGLGVRMAWKRRRSKLMAQEMCCTEWQNLVAEASRKGWIGEDELQWDSYDTRHQQLEWEWLQGVEKRKVTPSPKGSKGAPMSPEHRRKISQALSAKWADPEYRKRVCTAVAEYHRTAVGAKRMPKRVQSGSMEAGTEKIPSKKNAGDSHDSNISWLEGPSDTLKMLENISRQRATRKDDAVERARQTIAEAEKAAKALEAAAMRNHPLARSSLAEARRLINEAVQTIESIVEEGQRGMEAGTGPVLNGRHGRHVNGARAMDSGEDDGGIWAGRYSLLGALNGGGVRESGLDSGLDRIGAAGGS